MPPLLTADTSFDHRHLFRPQTASNMFAKLAVTAALCGAIVMGGTEAKKKGPTITNKVFFDIEIGARPPRPPSRSLKDKQGGPLLRVWPKTGALELPNSSWVYWWMCIVQVARPRAASSWAFTVRPSRRPSRTSAPSARARRARAPRASPSTTRAPPSTASSPTS